MTTPDAAPDGDSAEDTLRQHAEPAAEGTEETAEDRPDQPREHAEDPAEG